MLYLSQVLGAPVEDQQQSRVGRLIDVLVPEEQVGSSQATYPSALLIEGDEDEVWRIPPQAVVRHEDGLRVLREQLIEQAAGEHEVRLSREVLDKQVINMERKKAVRVNDVCFDDDWRLLGIDSSAPGLIRRLAPAWLPGLRPQAHSTALMPWEDIELIGSRKAEEEEQERAGSTGETAVPTRINSGHLAEMHPADIAEIIEQLTAGQGASLIERLDDETAADTMEEIDTRRQLHILENLDSERAADILQAMGPDEAADLIAQMSQERGQELLHLMTPEESEDVQELLGYEEDSAGGLMTTDYIVLNQSHSVSEALEAVRTNIREQDVRMAYVYCVADETQEEQRILGVVSVWDLLIAPPGQSLEGLMETDVITVQVDSEPQSVAEIIAKYNLLAVPVVNEEGILQGVITVDDVLDVLLPPERRHRSRRRMY